MKYISESAHFMDFPIGNGNPRNSEGSFLSVDGKDEILFAYTSFVGEKARDFTKADIKITRSHDGGRTWDTPVTVIHANDYDAMNVMSVSLLRMQNGDIGMIYLIRMNWLDMRIVMRYSADSGRTWGETIRCSVRDGYFVINNDRAIRLSSGRIIIPSAEHRNQINTDGKVIFAPAVTTFFYSDDDGKTWNESQTELSFENIPVCRSGLQEPGVIELKPGYLYGWARTDLGRQYEFISEDNGVTWSEAIPSRFTSPLSPMSMKRLQGGEIMAIWNPIPLNNIMKENKATGGRTPLVYSLSKDNGITWSDPMPIEDDPDAGYCYTAILPMDNAVLLAYCAGTEADLGSCLNRLRIRRLQLSSGPGSSADTPHCMGIGF